MAETAEEEELRRLRARAKAAEEECFKKGAKVEVNFNETGFKGSWYTGTIIHHHSGVANTTRKRPNANSNTNSNSNKIYVEFDTLSSSSPDRGNGGKPLPLREYIDVIFVRPAPPREANRSFKLSEDVDAYHKDGWWEGVVTAVHPSSLSPSAASSSSPSSAGSVTADTSYSVFFRSTREQIQFRESDLRLHREWVYGEWVPPLESSSTSAPPPPSA